MSEDVKTTAPVVGHVPVIRKESKYYFMHEDVATAKRDDGVTVTLKRDVIGGTLFATVEDVRVDTKGVMYCIRPSDIVETIFRAYDNEVAA